MLPVTGTVLLRVYITEICVREWFEITDNSVVDLLLGDLFIERYIPAIIPGELKLIPRHSSPMVVVKSHSASVSPLEKPNKEENVSHKIS